MICPSCGMQLPDDSEFCQYCGSKISHPVKQIPPVGEDIEAKETTSSNLQPIVTIPDPTNVQEHKDVETSIATPAKKRASKKWIATVIPLFLLLLGAIGLNIYQYIIIQDNTAKVTELSATVDRLNSTIKQKDTQIKNKNSQIAVLENRITLLTGNANKYDTIVNTIKRGNLGYATNNFRASESIIVVGRSEKNRKFTLTTNWSGSGTVSVDYSTIFPAAYVEFDQDSWTTSTKMTILPVRKGISVVTFSNNVNRQTFDIIIIVE